MRTAHCLMGALALAMTPATVRAQQGGYQVTGTVVEATTSAPLAGARVRLATAGFSTLTDRSGAFILPRGVETDTVVVSRIGFADVHVVVRGSLAPLIIRLAPAAVALPDLVSVASRRGERASDIVVPVTTVSRDDIARSGALAADQLLGELPGIQQSATPPAGNTLTVRGISGSRVLLLIDGEPAPGRHLEDRDVGRVSVAALDHVEIVKGPLAVMHGSQALGGVINLVSRPPSGPFAIEGDASAGSNGRRTAGVGAQAGGTVAWRVDGSVREQHQLGGQVIRDGALSRVWDGRGTVRHVTARGVALRADASWFRERQRWPTGGGFFGFNDNRGASAWVEALAPLAGGSTRVRVAGQDYAHRYREAASDVPYENTGTPTQQERSLRATISHARAIGKAHQLDAGIDVAAARVIAADRLLGERLSEQVAALYAQDAMTIGRLNATVGIRHTRGSRWGGTTTPSAGIAFEPVSSLRLRAGAARGFRSPSFKELGWNFTNPGAGYVIVGNSDLRPESGWQYFTGLTWSPGASVTVDVDAYHNALRDMIETAFTGTNEAGMAIYSPRNISRVMTRGVDVELRGAWHSTAASLSYAYLETRDRERDGPLTQRSPHTIRATVHRDAGPLQLGLVARYSASAPIIDAGGAASGTQHALAALDLNARLPVAAATELNLGIDNAFDAQPAGWFAPLRRSLWAGIRTAINP